MCYFLWSLKGICKSWLPYLVSQSSKPVALCFQRKAYLICFSEFTSNDYRRHYFFNVYVVLFLFTKKWYVNAFGSALMDTLDCARLHTPEV